MLARIRKTMPRHHFTGVEAVGFRSDGRPIWPIRGGSGDGDGGSGGDGGGGGDGSTGDGGKGGTGDGAGKPTDGGNGDGGSDDKTDWKAEAEKWKALSRKHESRASENAKAAEELERVKREGLSEGEKAVKDAADKAAADERAKLGPRLVKAEFKAAAVGRQVNGKPLDIDALLEDVDLTKYLDKDGEVDTDKVSKRLDALAPKSEDGDDTSRGSRRVQLGQGRRGAGDGVKSSVARGRELYREHYPSKT